MQPVTNAHLLRRPTPPAAASTMPPPPPPASNRAAPPPLQPPELPLPSALVPPKKRRVLRTPPKATIPLPPPPPPPVVPVAVAVPAPPTQPPQGDNAESPLFSAQKPSSPPPPPPAGKPSSPPPPPPPPTEKPPSSPPPPPAENPSSPPTPSPPPAENPTSPRPPPPAENPSSPPPSRFAEEPSSPPPPPPPLPSTADEKPSAPPLTDAAAEPAPARKARKITRKVRTIIKRVPKGTIAARKAAAVEASAADGASQPGKRRAPEHSSRNAAAAQREQSFGSSAIEKTASSGNPTAVCETLLGKGTAVCETETLLGKGMVGGGTLASGPEMDTDGEHDEKTLGGRGEDRAEVGMSERRRRMMTEVFVGGLNRDAKEEDVRAALSGAGEITEVRMIMDAKTKKNKGFCFVRYCEPAHARKAIAQFSNVKICGKQCRVAALDGNDKIFLGNINKKWKKEDIEKVLQKIGVENIDVVTLLADSNNPGYNRGFAFLELETYRDAQIAYRKLSRKDVFGKGLNIRVDWAEQDEKQMQKVNIRVSLAKSVQKGKKNMKDHKFCEKDKTKTAKSERILGPSSLHILPSSSRAVPVIGDKKSSQTHGLVHVLRDLAPWRHEHAVSGSFAQNYPRILSGEKRPFSALDIDSYCMSHNAHTGHERNTYATSTSSYSVSPPAITRYSPPYHHESRRCLLDSDSVLSEPWGGIQMRQACSRKSGMSHDNWQY